MAYKLYHYHLEHQVIGQLACIFVACEAEAAAAQVQTVAEGVVKRAYERLGNNESARREYEAGRITMVLKEDIEPLELPVDEPTLRDIQLLGTLTGDLLLAIAGDEKPLSLQPFALQMPNVRGFLN